MAALSILRVANLWCRDAVVGNARASAVRSGVGRGSRPSALDVLMSVTDAARVRWREATLSAVHQRRAGRSASARSPTWRRVDSTNRSVAVRVQAPTTRRPLRIGETVFGQIAVATRPNAVVIPLEALVPEGDAFHVFVVDANSIAHAREVTIGGKTDTSVEITEGLKAGERIVTFGAYGMQDSVKVVPLTAIPGEGDSAVKPVVPAAPAKP